jgi:hypothetical protein
MHYPNPHTQNGNTGEALSATLLGLALMAVLTTWWWYVMR